ncbi:MAG: hypothetical protein R2720_01845 [Candidatus Nanopelagicales bacterium]
MSEQDSGGAPVTVHDPTHSVTDMAADPGCATDVVYELVARQGRVELADGAFVDGFSPNGRALGLTIRALPGQLVEARVRIRGGERGG